MDKHKELEKASQGKKKLEATIASNDNVLLIIC